MCDMIIHVQHGRSCVTWSLSYTDVVRLDLSLSLYQQNAEGLMQEMHSERASLDA